MLWFVLSSGSILVFYVTPSYSRLRFVFLVHLPGGGPRIQEPSLGEQKGV